MAEEPPSTEHVVPSFRPRVLVVDDDRELRATIRDLLADEGYPVLEAADGVEALAALRQAADRLVVVLDWQMPRLDGAGVLGAVSADRVLSQEHVYMLLTAGMQTLRLPFAQLLTALDVTVLHKPFDIHELLALVAHLAQKIAQP